MSIPTPTGDAAAALPGWMPDEATLTQMANEFFGALTISEPAAPALAVPAGQPVTDLPPGTGSATAPVLPYLGTLSPAFYFVTDRPASAAPPGIPAHAWPAFDVEAVRRDFPILNERVHGRQLVWLDNAATTQKPQAVIDRLAYFYAHENSNVHRGAHTLDQPGRPELGPETCLPRRRDHHFLPGAPRQHRAVAAAGPGDRSNTEGHPCR
jgi:hypothetical protein